MSEYEDVKPQQIVIIEFSKATFEQRFYELRNEGYRATQISVAQSPVTNNAPNNTFMALMEF